MSPETMPAPVLDEMPWPGDECEPDYDEFITEDDTPVDTLYHELQRVLLAYTLRESWKGPGEGGPFISISDVGMFYRIKTPAIVPDMLLSLGVAVPDDVWPKKNRSYFIWNYGKPPDAVVEVVSNTKGKENDEKLRIYASCGVTYYVVWDPQRQIQSDKLVVHVLNGGRYERMEGAWLPRVGLGLAVWRGVYGDISEEWLRWCDHDGVLIPTGAERAIREKARADEATEKLRIAAESEAIAKDDAAKHEARIQRLLAQLQRLGHEPDSGEHKAD